MGISLIAIPAISALIGWFTNWVAIKMLFHPQKPMKLLFIECHGVFPKNQKKVAEKFGELIATELFSSKEIRYRMTHSTDTIRRVIEEKIDYYLTHTFTANHPIISVLFGDKRKAKVREDLAIEVEKAAPDVIDQYLTDIEREIDVSEIVREKIENLSPARLEGLIMGILQKEFKFIEYIGAVIGLLIGLLQVGIVYFS
jgi:uncharacterized membrane protein YheB (UPF0754 family)